MTYDEAITFWFERINYEVRSAGPKDLKLERMRALLRAVGDPHRRVRTVHVTGTKGKGSTSAMLAAILQASGYRVGLFTSPHLVRVEERIQVDGQPIRGEELAALIDLLRPAVLELERGPFPPPTFFELSTALGFLHFVQRRVDIAVLEVGLGGRFDSTNVCEPLVSIITSIGPDHMAQLGSTLEAIAYQKAGIIKPGVPCISGVVQPGPQAVIHEEAQQRDSRISQLGQDFRFDYWPRPIPHQSEVTIQLGHAAPRRYSLRLLGAHQATNAALAVAAANELQLAGLSIPETAIATGLRTVRWPARMEVVRTQPTVILDTAHNVPSVEALVRTLDESLPGIGKKRLIFAVSSDKQYEPMLRLLAEAFDEIYLTKYGNNPRCVAPETLAELIAGFPGRARYSIHPTAKSAWDVAWSITKPDDLLAISGSVFLAGEMMPLLDDLRYG